MKRVIVDIVGREHDSTGKSLSGFKAVRGNLFIGDEDRDGHVSGRFGRERFLFTDLLDEEVLAVLRHAVRTGFRRADIAPRNENRLRKLREWCRMGMPPVEAMEPDEDEVAIRLAEKKQKQGLIDRKSVR